MERDDLTSGMDGRKKSMSSHMIIEAELVAEEDIEGLRQDEREQMEVELRGKFIGEMGQVAQAEVVEDDGSKPRRRALLCSVIVVILSAIILGVVLGTRDNSSPETITVLEVLYVDQYRVGSQAFQDLSSPQSRALVWMARNDSSDLQSTMSDDELAERFSLVNFYYATGGESWRYQAGFLSPLNNTCSWNSKLEGTTRVLGVSCNEEGSVVTLDLGKFPKSSTFLFKCCTNKINLTLVSTL
jgi:hypothetical protein